MNLRQALTHYPCETVLALRHTGWDLPACHPKQPYLFDPDEPVYNERLGICRRLKIKDLLVAATACLAARDPSAPLKIDPQKLVESLLRQMR